MKRLVQADVAILKQRKEQLTRVYRWDFLIHLRILENKYWLSRVGFCISYDIFIQYNWLTKLWLSLIVTNFKWALILLMAFSAIKFWKLQHTIM